MRQLVNDIIHKLCMIWTAGTWPKEWCETLFIQLRKKGSYFTNFRMIVQISHLEIFSFDGNVRGTGGVPGIGTREQIPRNSMPQVICASWTTESLGLCQMELALASIRRNGSLNTLSICFKDSTKTAKAKLGLTTTFQTNLI